MDGLRFLARSDQTREQSGRTARVFALVRLVVVENLVDNVQHHHYEGSAFVASYEEVPDVLGHVVQQGHHDFRNVIDGPVL